MLKLVHIGNTMPFSYIVDHSAEFQPGQIGQLVVIGNQVMMTISNGTAPIGVIDDIKCRSFTNISWDEVIEVLVEDGAPGPGNTIITTHDIKMELARPNIIPSSFTTTVPVALNPVNGVITFPTDTILNFDMLGTGIPNAIRAVVRYTYYVANIPGDDSTAGTGRVTVWYEKFIFQTNQYETNRQYPLNANLYVSEKGFLTTRRPSDIHPAVGMVTAPPSALNSQLECLWF